MISLILACDLNGTIGIDNKLPWGHLKADMKHFMDHTNGKLVVFGRKTFEAMNKPLPNRQVLILSNSNFKSEYGDTFNSIDDILDAYDKSDKDLVVCGGMNVYEQFMPYVQEIYLTLVNGTFEGDTVLSSDIKYSLFNDFKEEFIEFKEDDSSNEHPMEFFKYTRIKGEYN